MYGIITLDTMLQVSFWNLAISAGGIMLSFAIFSYTVSGNINKKINEKADRAKVEKMEEDMRSCEKSKAGIEYVDKQINSVHHRISENEEHNKEKLDMIISTVNTISKKMDKLMMK